MNDKPDFLKITFQRGYYDHYDPDPSAGLEIPVRGELLTIPKDLKDCYIRPENLEVTLLPAQIPGHLLSSSATQFTSPPFREEDNCYSCGAVEFDLGGAFERMQLRWIKERDEWVSSAYKQSNFGADGHAEWYYGPYCLDNYCIDRLLEAYHIPTGKLPYQEIKMTDPSLLLQTGIEGVKEALVGMGYLRKEIWEKEYAPAAYFMNIKGPQLEKDEVLIKTAQIDNLISNAISHGRATEIIPLWFQVGWTGEDAHLAEQGLYHSHIHDVDPLYYTGELTLKLEFGKTGEPKLDFEVKGSKARTYSPSYF